MPGTPNPAPRMDEALQFLGCTDFAEQSPTVKGIVRYGGSRYGGET